MPNCDILCIKMAKKPTYTVIDGMRLPPSFVPEVFRAACNFKPDKGEVVVATYPKCGTTWTLQMVVTILRKGRPPQTKDEYFACMPFLEITPPEQVKQMPKPGCIKAHLPFDRITYSPEAKYIYVARHPADCVVSYFHHTRYFPVYQFTDGSFDDFFELFIDDGVDFGDYFDHLLSWYEQRHLPNVLLLTYESMKADPKAAIVKIARFLDEELADELLADEEALLEDVLKYTSLDYMKGSVNGFYAEVFSGSTPKEVQEHSAVMTKYAGLVEEAMSKGHTTKGNFIRKGEVGEGKIALTEDQKNRLDARIREKTAHSDVMDLWKNFSI
ncbi:hypothetical protein JTE90_009780 [Oedothorax gibbosus]|uniref:Sulfotransferase domain-containing protein n=1 Tax=Oedothorax gibbosus TaxID=931172 RepID=A0AAV6V7T8_9ARAC|nr:hypothetical protein JTE90_009780 [Oedothorax gibbosus]